MAEMDPLGRKTRSDNGQQIGAVDRDVRGAVKLLAERVERRALQSAAILPTALVATDRAHSFAVEPFGEPEPAQDARRVRAHIDAAADLGELRRLLVEIHFEAGLTQPDGGAQPADAAANHGDIKWRSRHPGRRSVAFCRLPAGQRLMRLRYGGVHDFPVNAGAGGQFDDVAVRVTEIN